MASSSSSGAPSGSSAHAGAGGGPSDEAKLALIQQLMEIDRRSSSRRRRRLVERSWNIEAVLASHFAGSDAPASNASAAFDAPAGAELQRFCQRPFIVFESNLDADFYFAPRQTAEEKAEAARKAEEKRIANLWWDSALSLGLRDTPEEVATSLAQVKVLLEAGQPIDAIGGPRKSTALHDACWTMRAPIVRFLPENGADCNIVYRDPRDYIPKEVRAPVRPE